MGGGSVVTRDVTHDSEPKVADQLALLPAPEPAPRLFVEQPAQDVLRLARPVVTVRAEAYL